MVLVLVAAAGLFKTKSIILNAEFIICKAEFNICDTKSIILNTEFIICKAESISFGTPFLGGGGGPFPGGFGAPDRPR